jgi:hypothetical protein
MAQIWFGDLDFDPIDIDKSPVSVPSQLPYVGIYIYSVIVFD